MKLIKCPKCGEMYSDSYKTCPFCQEDEALKGRSAAPHRKVTKHRRAPSILGPAMVLVVVLAAVLVGVLLFGGKGSANKPADKPPVEEPTPAPTEPLTLDQTTLNMNQGETATLTVTGAENVLWTSSDPNVATVDDSGTVTAGVPGTATITVTTADGSQSAACTVQVATPLPPEPPKEELGLRSIYQAKGETISEFSTSVGAAVQMRVDGTEQTITWTIEDPKIATVTADGLVTGVAKGKTVLKGYSKLTVLQHSLIRTFSCPYRQFTRCIIPRDWNFRISSFFVIVIIKFIFI